MQTALSFSPLTIGSASAGLVLAVAVLAGLYQSRRAIGAVLKKGASALFSQIGFFTIVILVFLVISVLESGEFFNVNVTHEALFGILGYALALGFDLVSVVCMLARMSAIRLRDERGARLNLLGVVLCAAVSAFANAAASLQGYNASNLDHTPWWMQQVAPWLGTIFPTMIVVLSLTTDHLLDHRGPSRGIDLVTYRAQEKRRVDMLQIKLDTEKELLSLDKELAHLRVQREQAGGRLPREWVWTRWLRPVVPPTQEVIAQTIEETVDKARQSLDTRIDQLHLTFLAADTHLNRLNTQAASHDQALATLREQASSLLTRTQAITAHLITLDEQASRLTEQIEALNVQMHTLHTAVQSHPIVQQRQASRDLTGHSLSSEQARRTHRTIKLDMMSLDGGRSQGSEKDGRVAIEERILEAQRTLGPGASNRQIARLAHCSPTTVAKWRVQQEHARSESA
jgi:hypothetical protein